MAPKIEAACSFVNATGGSVAIGSLSEAEKLLMGIAGSRISRDGIDLAWYDGPVPQGPERSTRYDPR